MKTSRIARETARIAERVSQIDNVGPRQTRSLASLHRFAANGVAPFSETDISTVKQEECSDDDSSLSSLSTSATVDIEDLPTLNPPSQKRKRGIETSISTRPTAGSSPCKTEIQAEDGKVRKSSSKRSQKASNNAGEVEIHSPANWEEIYDSVKEMRKKVLAPVDTMGCETLAEENITPRDKRFQTLIALMLSSQTKDTTNAIAMRRLQTELPPPGLTLENILEVDPVRLNELIYVVGFHNNKTRYIKATALILKDRFAGDIPDTIEGLISLPGVGPKMAYLCLSAAWGRTEGIGVDVHVHRITNLWRWHKTKAPEETRAALQAWLPREKWHEINHLLVGFGQTICLPIGRKCESCTLSSGGLCPSAVLRRKQITKKMKREDQIEDKGAYLQHLKTETSFTIKEESMRN